MSTEKKTKSRYARKLARKAGKGPVNPRWMWWLESTEKPRDRRGAIVARSTRPEPEQA